MLTLFRLFSRLSRRGRREERARKWDAAADRMARRANVYGQVVESSARMGVSTLSTDHFRTRLEECRLAEDAARKMATKIRSGEL